MRRLEPSEKQIQTSFFEWLKFKTDVRSYAFAIPNGGYRNKFEAYNLSKSGVSSGAPDLFIAIPNNILNYHGLVIEMKTKNGRLSNAQKVWIDRLNGNGYLAKVCYSLDEAIETVNYYIEG